MADKEEEKKDEASIALDVEILMSLKCEDPSLRERIIKSIQDHSERYRVRSYVNGWGEEPILLSSKVSCAFEEIWSHYAQDTKLATFDPAAKDNVFELSKDGYSSSDDHEKCRFHLGESTYTGAELDANPPLKYKFMSRYDKGGGDWSIEDREYVDPEPEDEEEAVDNTMEQWTLKEDEFWAEVFFFEGFEGLDWHVRFIGVGPREDEVSQRKKKRKR